MWCRRPTSCTSVSMYNCAHMRMRKIPLLTGPAPAAGVAAGMVTRVAAGMATGVAAGRFTALCFTLTASLLFLPPLNAQWQETDLGPGDMAANLEEALTFTRYPTYPQYVAMMQHFAESWPEICRLDTFGTTPQGRLLLALKISDHAAGEEAEAPFFYTATMHGDELLGYPLLLRLADTLLSGYGKDAEITRVVDELAIWINPLSNPDATFYPDNNESVAGSIRETPPPWNRNLNRDFPDPSAGETDDTTGRAPETRAMMEFLREKRFALSANIHGGEEVVNYPWDHTYDLHPDDAWFRFISREYADEAHAVDPLYMDLFEDGITNGAAWYPIMGGRQDYVTWYLEGREVTLELSEVKQLGSQYLEEFWWKNYRSLLNYMTQCTYGIRGQVTDGASGKALRARIEIPGYDSAWSVVHSRPEHGDYYRLLKEGVYDVVCSAPGYVPDTARGVQVVDYQATFLDFQLEPYKSGNTGLFAVPAFLLYPNPAHSFLILERSGTAAGIGKGSMELSILRLDGTVLYRQVHPAATPLIRIGTGEMESGMYLLRLSSEDRIRTFRFVKE
jgi:hypothetical protein